MEGFEDDLKSILLKHVNQVAFKLEKEGVIAAPPLVLRLAPGLLYGKRGLAYGKRSLSYGKRGLSYDKEAYYMAKEAPHCRPASVTAFFYASDINQSTCMHAYIHTYKHTYIHVYIHIRMLSTTAPIR